MSKSTVDIIIPTVDQNEGMLALCVESLLASCDANILIINNGSQRIKIGDHRITLIEAGGNIGWERGLKLGLQHSKTPCVVFANDDIFIPRSSYGWLDQLLRTLRQNHVGAVGPSSNVVMGPQTIFYNLRESVIEVNFLIGFCVLFSREALDAVGGVDDTLPGGDDLDLSIRLRNAGWRLLCRRDVFVWHYGFQTGIRLRGGPEKSGGWNSKSMQDATMNAIIARHGEKAWKSLSMPFRSLSAKNSSNLESLK